MPGDAPREHDLAGGDPSGGVLWIDVCADTGTNDLLDLLEPHCPGLEREMVEDLRAPDELPEGRRWRNGSVRLASSFAVYPPSVFEGSTASHESSAHAVYQPVELLAGDGWLVTRWHDACEYCGSRLVQERPPLDHAEVIDAVAQRWARGAGGSAGDLGVLVMRELALTYAPAHRALYAALERWELSLYGVEGVGETSEEALERELRDLWGARARLRDWLNPLNVAGLREDADKAWLPARDHDTVVAVDDRVDKALDELLAIGDTLRDSFQMLHIRKSEAQRERHEATQRRIETLAAIFLIPTLIVGFYGANTWVPGEQRHWGFWVMVVVMVALTAVGASVVWVLHGRRNVARSLPARRSFEP
jgi:hypothetical protein